MIAVSIDLASGKVSQQWFSQVNYAVHSATNYNFGTWIWSRTDSEPYLAAFVKVPDEIVNAATTKSVTIGYKFEPYLFPFTLGSLARKSLNKC